MKYLIIALLALGMIIPAYADYTRGPDYINVLNNGHGFFQSAPEWIYDYTDWQNHPVYSPYKLSQDNNSIQIYSAQDSFGYSKQGCAISLYDKGPITPNSNILIKSESVTVQDAQNGTDIWYNLPVNTQACSTTLIQNDTGNFIDSVKQDINGIFKLTWAKPMSNSLEVYSSYTNLDNSKPDYKFGFTEALQINGWITIGNTTYYGPMYPNISNAILVSNQTVNISYNQINNHTDISFHNYNTSIIYSMKDAKNFLWNIRIVNSGPYLTLMFDYKYIREPLPVGDTTILDPTFGYNAATTYEADTSVATGASCPGGPYSIRTLFAYNYIPASASGDLCQRTESQWDISSITSGIVVQAAKLKFDIVVSSSPRNCDYNSVEFKPSTASAATIWGDAGNGTTYLSNDPTCASGVGNNKTLTLPASARSDITSAVNSGQTWWALASKSTTESRDGSLHDIAYNNNNGHYLYLQFNYTNIPTSFSIRALNHDNTTVTTNAIVTLFNKTFSTSGTVNSTGWFTYTNNGINSLLNMTIRDPSSNFIVAKDYNLKINSGTTALSYLKTYNDNVYDVSCPNNPNGKDFRTWINGTDGHKITSIASGCNSLHDITVNATFTANGNSGSSFTTKLNIKSLNVTTYNYMPSNFKLNGSAISYSYNNTTKTANSTAQAVGTGMQTRVLQFRVVTDNVTSSPILLGASPLSTSSIKINFQPSLISHGSSATGYQIIRNGTIITNNTGTSTLNYNDTGLTTNHRETYTIKEWNRIGLSPSSGSVSGTTWTVTTGTVTLASNVVGDVIQINATTNILTGSPSPVTLQTLMLYRNGTSYQNTTYTQSITVGSSFTGTPFWYQYTNANNQTWSVKAKVTNFTGTPSQTIVTLTSSSISKHRTYLPSYFTATVPALGQVNYTMSRSADQKTITLSANRNLGGTTFPMECLYQTANQAIFGGSAGTWVNKSTIGYWYQAQTVSPTQAYYITCYDPNDQLFSTHSLVNGSSILFGISQMDSTYGAYLGVPAGIFFVVMAASLASQRTAPMWVIILLGMIGMMATIGFFTLSPAIWALALIAGLLALIVGRKVF